MQESTHSVDSCKEKICAMNANYIRILRILCDEYIRHSKTTHFNYYEKEFRWNPEDTLRDYDFIIKSSNESQKPKQGDKLELLLKKLNDEAALAGGVIYFEKVCSEHLLTKEERIILATLYFKCLEYEDVKGMDLLRIAAVINGRGPLNMTKFIASSGTLRKTGLIEEKNDYRVRNNALLFERMFRISNNTFWEITGESDLLEDETKQIENNTSVLDLRDPTVSFENLILSDDIKNQIEAALWQYQNSNRVYEEQGIKNLIPYGRATTILFYGPPGTGKTATCEAIAHYLGKKIGVAGYDQIYNKYVGVSEKHMVDIFKVAKQNDCVLVFDEADSFFGSRINENDAVDRSFNTMTNILMQQIERFEGLVILTTNREVNIDSAFERRLLYRLKFDISTPEQRSRIWQCLLKDCRILGEDVSFNELGRYPLVGGKIKNAVLKTVMQCDREKRLITMSDLIQSAKQEAQGDLYKEKERKIGF